MVQATDFAEWHNVSQLVAANGLWNSYARMLARSCRPEERRLSVKTSRAGPSLMAPIHSELAPGRTGAVSLPPEASNQ